MLDFLFHSGSLESDISAKIDYLIKSHTCSQHMPKGTVLMSKGETDHKLFYLKKGLARAFYYDEEGRDVTTWFIVEDEVLFLANPCTDSSSFEYIELLEKSEIILVSYSTLQKMYHQFPELNINGRVFLERLLAKYDTRFRALRIVNAQERFAHFQRQFPAISSRAPLKHVASYLGITPSTLSRLRAVF